MINTGNGKGKSTAAFGQLFRALGAGLNCAVIQFIKKQKSSEIKLLEKHFPHIPIHITGLGFTWNSKNLPKDTAAAQEGWEQAACYLQDSSIELIILDELTYPLNYGMLNKNAIYNTLKNRPTHQHVIITGRDASEKLQSLAQTITDMTLLKHHFDTGIESQLGVEY